MSATFKRIMIYDETQALRTRASNDLPSFSQCNLPVLKHHFRRTLEKINLSLYIFPVVNPRRGRKRNVAKNALCFFPFFYRDGGYENTSSMSNTRELLSISSSWQVVNNSADAVRSSRSLAPLFLSSRCSIHRRGYTMCVSGRPQIALSHCCCPVVRALSPAVAGDDRIVQGAP